VIVSGGDLTAFEGAPLYDLFVYAYRGGAWQQIPFQFDEVDATGTYTVENGLLDANDELVFMAPDLGTQAVPWVWIPDTASQASPRYQSAVSDPLDAGQHGWVYVYRSADLAPASSGDYVDWDAVNHRLVGTTYVVGFDPAVHPGIETLELNGAAVDLTAFRLFEGPFLNADVGGRKLTITYRGTRRVLDFANVSVGR
jgi:hypothetical protein